MSMRQERIIRNMSVPLTHEVGQRGDANWRFPIIDNDAEPSYPLMYVPMPGATGIFDIQLRFSPITPCGVNCAASAGN